jgi:AraC-like DNA-binding protein
VIDAYVRSCFAREAVPRVSELARELGVSRGTLISAIKNLEGVTPVKYLRRQKALRAEELLRQGLVIERVAREACYGTRRAFFRSFLAETGITPATYRLKQNVTSLSPKVFTRERD